MKQAEGLHLRMVEDVSAINRRLSMEHVTKVEQRKVGVCVRLYVCVCLCVRVCVYVYAYSLLFSFLLTCVRVNICLKGVLILVHREACVLVFVCVVSCFCVCMYVCVCE
jgi:hypothetical protein